MSDLIEPPVATDPGHRLKQLTKPVQGALQRPTPRWVGWFLITVPTLATIGSMIPAMPHWLFEVAVVVLLVTAAWDWWRFQDRSRTMWIVLSMAAAFTISGIVAFVVSSPARDAAAAQAGVMALGAALALSFVQLYRTAETVLTVARGWLYMTMVVLFTVAVNWLRSGTSQGLVLITGWGNLQLATVLVLAAVVLGLGFALEHDRRLKWAYPVVSLPIPIVVAATGSALALSLVWLVALVWLLPHRWGRILGLPALVLAAGFIPSSRDLLGQLLRGITDPQTSIVTRLNLIGDGAALLRRTDWFGVGPAGFGQAMTSQPVPFPTAGVTLPFSAALELAVEYGIGAFILLCLVALGGAKWAVQRLIRTRATSWSGPDRAPALWTLTVLVVWPVASSVNGTWLGQPFSALFVATVVMWGRHLERPLGLRVHTTDEMLRSLPPGPSAAGEREEP